MSIFTPKLTDSFLELPTVTELNSELDDTQLYYKYPTKHYFQFTTNVPKVKSTKPRWYIRRRIIKIWSTKCYVSMR